MIEVRNKKNYYTSLSRLTLLILFAFAVVQLINASFLIGATVIFFFIEIILLNEKFTESIIINHSDLIISYYCFFSKKQLIIPRGEMNLKLTRKASFRSPQYCVLAIFENKYKVYEVDSRDGFPEEDLERVKKFVENPSFGLSVP